MGGCGAPFLQSGSPSWTARLTQLNDWLLDQAIHVPDGWIEACVTWLVDEHGGWHACDQLTESDWCQLIYDQWLHSDLHQLSSPVLPDWTSSQLHSPLAMLLEGELCLQVVSLLDVGESYYGQLRRTEGNLSKDLPDLEGFGDPGWEAGNPNWTQMTQAARSHYDLDQSLITQSNSMKSVALILTDGVTVIKAVEFGTNPSNRAGRHGGISPTELAMRLRPGVKLRLCGPITLRRNVLLLPPGSIRFLDHAQLRVLGGEVDELLNSPSGNISHQIGLQLAEKLHISIEDSGALPVWFPCVSQLRQQQQQQQPPPHAEEQIESLHPPSESACPPSNSVESMIADVWNPDDDDALLSQAASNLEQQLSIPISSGNTVKSMIEAMPTQFPVTPNQPLPNFTLSNPMEDDAPDLDLSAEVDPDVLASAFDELDSAMLLDNRRIPQSPPSSRIAPICKPQPTISVSSTQCLSTTQPAAIETDPTNSVPGGSETVPTTVHDDLLPPLPKRKPWLRKPIGQSQSTRSNSDSTRSINSLPKTNMDNKFVPFCYIEDIYNDLINSNNKIQRRVYTIRGLLLNLVSPLAHHQGTKWTLAARLTDGSATVDVDIAPELLTQWIGLTAAEGESLRQLSRCSPNAGLVAVQEAAKHRYRLRTAVNDFQQCLSHLSGLFDITPPPATVTSMGGGPSNGGPPPPPPPAAVEQPCPDGERPIRPILIAHRQLDEIWLEQLHHRVTARAGI